VGRTYLREYIAYLGLNMLLNDIAQVWQTVPALIAEGPYPHD
jgi:hypothetical protein